MNIFSKLSQTVGNWVYKSKFEQVSNKYWNTLDKEVKKHSPALVSKTTFYYNRFKNFIKLNNIKSAFLMVKESKTLLSKSTINRKHKLNLIKINEKYNEVLKVYTAIFKRTGKINTAKLREASKKQVEQRVKQLTKLNCKTPGVAALVNNISSKITPTQMRNTRDLNKYMSKVNMLIKQARSMKENSKDKEIIDKVVKELEMLKSQLNKTQETIEKSQNVLKKDVQEFVSKNEEVMKQGSNSKEKKTESKILSHIRQIGLQGGVIIGSIVSYITLYIILRKSGINVNFFNVPQLLYEAINLIPRAKNLATSIVLSILVMITITGLVIGVYYFVQLISFIIEKHTKK